MDRQNTRFVDQTTQTLAGILRTDLQRFNESDHAHQQQNRFERNIYRGGNTHCTLLIDEEIPDEDPTTQLYQQQIEVLSIDDEEEIRESVED